MRTLFHWLRSHPGWCIAGLILAFFGGSLALANWTAEQRWQRYAAAARARGVEMSLEEFAPPPASIFAMVCRDTPRSATSRP